MIKCNEGEVEIRGAQPMILTDFALIACSLKKANIPEELIKDSLDIGLMSEEERKAEHARISEEFIKKIAPQAIAHLTELIKQCSEGGLNDDIEEDDD